MNLLEFMSDSPILTFFLACIIANGIVGLARALRGLPDAEPEND